MKKPVDIQRPKRRPLPLPETGHTFRAPALLLQALTHPSYAAEHPGEADYERLEFLGDAVLDLVVAALLYRRFPDWPEGALSKARHRLVAEESLAGIARDMSLGPCMRLGRGATLDGSRDRPRVLADVLEAIVGALYLDAGPAAVHALLDARFGTRIDALAALPGLGDAKSRLQEFTQQGWHGSLPLYAPLEGSGPSHARVFRARVTLPDGRHADGEGHSRQSAEQSAAAALLPLLTEIP